MRTYWPGRTTLIVSARPVLPAACRQRGQAAVRVDANDTARYLARLCGGLLLSSSLNRSSQPPAIPNRTLRMRWRRHLAACDAQGDTEGRPSALLCVSRTGERLLR